MLPKKDPTQTSSWKKLKAHYAEMKTVQMKTFFDNDPERFEKMSIPLNDLIFDYSKNIVTAETEKYLLELAAECQLKPAIEAMFNGEKNK
jgi:glucose-6-phosphate isomerase